MLHVLDRGLTAVCVVATVLVLVLLFAGPSLIGAKKSSPTGATSGSVSGAPSGSAVFASAKCGGCHTLKAAAANGTTGPDLDRLAAYAQTAGKPLNGFIHQSIVTPNAYVEKGYPKGVMPDFGKTLSTAQVGALVDFLAASVNRKQP
jgi:mono/diheme cytochrome c family protein